MPQSHERAVELFKLGEAQGEAQGDAGATNGLGICHSNGWGVDQSVYKARRLYELAVARGDASNAPDNLQRLNDQIQQYCPLLDQSVVLRGLNTATLNGMRGTAVDFSFGEIIRHPTDPFLWRGGSGRYTVRLDGPEGRLIKARLVNVSEG